MLWSWLGNLIAGPILGKALDAYKAKLSSGNTSERIAADLAARELDVQKRETEVNSQFKIATIGRWYEPEHLFAYILVIYFAKTILWDKVLASVTGGYTDPLTGDVAVWAGMIMSFYVGKRGIENVARILKSK